jgi:hypothetical protein
MPDFLTRRNGTWHFVRRVPNEFRELDRRGIVKHTTKIRVASDRTGRLASRVAIRLNEALETYCRNWPSDSRSERITATRTPGAAPGRSASNTSKARSF